MVNLSDFPNRLKELMNERNDMKSERLAKEANISGSSIRSFLRGQSVPNFQTAIKLADFFRCSLDYLVGFVEEYQEVVPRPLPPFYAHLREIMKNAGVTRLEITQKTAIKDAFFTNWSHGELPLLITLCTLANYLEVSLDYLVGRAEY